MTIAESNATLPENISRIIKESGVMHQRVAKQSGLTAQQLSYMLNGRKIIKPCDILAISDALGVSVNDLFGARRKRPGKSDQKSAST